MDSNAMVQLLLEELPVHHYAKQSPVSALLQPF